MAAAAVVLAACVFGVDAYADASAVSGDGKLGLYPATAFTVARGADAGLAPAPAFYFADELVAARAAAPAAPDYVPGLRAFADVRRWVADENAPRNEPPALVWIASPTRVTGARLDADASHVRIGDRTYALALAPRNPLNRSWFDASSAAWLAPHALTLRGAIDGDRFVARTLWPEEFRLVADARVEPLPSGDPALALRALVRRDADGGAREPWLQRRLWQRTEPDATPAGGPRTVLVVMVNGAQGDDDEAWGGHFALGTGTLPADGRLSDVLINNFYSLDIVSEKGILAAPVPLDRYLADVNSGQAWYRPSHLVVATLADPRAAFAIQGALNRVIAQFWRHQLTYAHATMNCAGISVDTLRALGWAIPARPPSSTVLGWLAVPYTLARYGSLGKARDAYEYLTEDPVRLMPQAAFEAIGAELVRLTAGAAPADGALAQALAHDVVALDFVQVPQWPSSRAFGSYAVVTPFEYEKKVPPNPSDRQIVPVPPRPFPDALRTPDLVPPPRRPSDLPVAVWGAALAALVALLVRWLWRRAT
ncbi:MAG: hypothetical protein JSR18_04115 [Proteobacteria bacterium]|nr:hypothetical protein [Pseudomonadota bacterium]